MAGSREQHTGQRTPRKWTVTGDVKVDGDFELSNGTEEQSEILFDYERAEGGIPFIETSKVISNGEDVQVEIVFSETYAGLHSETGDGPFLLFSNAMDTYRVHTQTFKPSTTSSRIQLPFAQRSQRYQKVILKTPNSAITISSIGYIHVRPPNPTISTFNCSNEKLNKIWRDGVRTVDMCTVEAGETAEAWEITEEGTRILGQHWAPCRQGTRWGDMKAEFEVKIERGGAGWGVHMVANGLIFCLDVAKRSLGAFEGLSDINGVFPSIPRGIWDIGPDIDCSGWLKIVTIARGDSVLVEINGIEVASLSGLDVHPILGGSGNNTGSIAFGGPQGYISLYRALKVSNDEQVLYQNSLQLQDKDRTLADFAVGTNALACTIDGAKRDRACFGGDLFVMGRSICYSTGNLNAILGSIKLLTSHQTADGYLGNLCPIQAPMHEDTCEPPTYAFYSLSYALLLIVAIKDYWMHSGDNATIGFIWPRLEKLLSFTEKFIDERGLVVAPPPLSMDWFPMGGPIFGASGKINLAFYDALRSMSSMSTFLSIKDTFLDQAATLKESIIHHLWNSEAGIMRMSDLASPTGICQDINAYAITTGVSPAHASSITTLSAPFDGTLPLAFQGIERWDQKKVVSPYASGFAVEALFERDQGTSAIELLERVWGVMSDQSSPNYSGGHWEAMKADGTPITDDTSLMHGWSTWPVYLLPRYLAGLQPLEPGWIRWRVKPVLAGSERVDVGLSTPAGNVKVSMELRETMGTGSIVLGIPLGSTAEVFAPEGWIIVTSEKISDASLLASQTIRGQEEEVTIRICRIGSASQPSTDSEKDTIHEQTEEILVPAKSRAGAWRPVRRLLQWFM
ncbi:bacterial alpha-L-rhamnosidase domain-containing protein [Mollisia scopiformis]|uniref:Bacterial alpha-L-rhamnosidase domain-containing protein n=1 Tax=Mollisia scopiformis TaxID=149040 RepID=A0A194X8Z0_MOLSC|nr:bacterial alpha-L-rhamnosidase domain-containing protein [Mollisia scopiformis]KUJ16636.1 bacterial alpha-L-rhamnosidase domain-containing protein [Mollisia scopiformis]